MTKVEMTKVEYNGKQLDIPKYLLQEIEFNRNVRDMWYYVAKYAMGELDREQRLDFMVETIMTDVYDKTPKKSTYLEENKTYENDVRWYKIAINSARNLSHKWNTDLITLLLEEDAEVEPKDEDFHQFLRIINIKRTLYNIFKKHWDPVYLRSV
jgi:hypothetical protein